MNTYRLQLRGQIDVNELNALSPHHMTAERVEPTTTCISICTDQAGMIGLLRHLHNLDLTVLAVTCQLDALATEFERKEA